MEWSAIVNVGIAVVIPLYNQRPYLSRALRSVLAQSYPAEEIIVVDDGSEDGGAANTPECNDPRLRVLRQKNRGVSMARNAGIDAASCEWIAFLDADDEWLPGFLEHCVKAIQNFPHAVAVFSNYVGHGKRAALTTVPPEPEVLMDYFRFAARNHGHGMFSSAVMARKSALEAIGGFPSGVKHAEDLDTWQRLAWTGDVVVVPTVQAVYHTETPGSAVKDPGKEVSFPVLKTYRSWIAESRVPQHLQRSSLDLIRLQMRWHVQRLVRSGRRWDAIRTLVTVCRWRPYPSEYARLWAHCILPRPVMSMIRKVVRRKKCRE